MVLYILLNGLEEKYTTENSDSDSQTPEVVQKAERKERGNEAVSHLILAVLAGWSPQDDRTGEYCRKRQEIFRMAQPYFQPVALSFVTDHEQKEYLLERDFLTYHSEILCQKWEQPLEFLRRLLRQHENGEITDAHLAFQGEQGICTEDDWDRKILDDMAREGILLLAAYSGFGACEFLFH